MSRAGFALARTVRISLASLLVLSCTVDEAPPPDILLITADDMGVDLGAYGVEAASTPTLDRLARDGMRFDASFAVAPVCSPSRSAILTGHFPHQTGHTGFPSETRLAERIRTLPAELQRLGYFTALVGRLHVAPYDPENDSRQIPFDHRSASERRDTDSVDRLRSRLRSVFDASADRPLFLMVNLRAPHTPYPGTKGVPAWSSPHDPKRVPVPTTIPDDFSSRVIIARMFDAYSLADSLVAAVLDEVEESSRAANTLVVFTSDQGPALLGAKATLFDPGIQVPLMVRWPDVVERGSTSDALVSGVDLFTTLIEAAGGSAPQTVQGRSLLSLLRGDPTAERRSAVYAENTRLQGNRYFPQRSLRTPRFKYVRTLRPDLEARFNSIGHWVEPLLERWHSDERARLLLERTVRQPREALFDLVADPRELHNVAGDPDYAGTLRELRDKLQTWMRETDDPWLALWDHRAGDDDAFEPERTRDGAFRKEWLDEAVARATGTSPAESRGERRQ